MRPLRAQAGRAPRMVLLAGIAWFSSLGVVWSYGKVPGCVAYTVVVAGAAWLVPRLHVSARQARMLLGLVAVAALVNLFVVYPHANVHSPNVGSDDDDALNLAARTLLAGRYPYTEAT